jgi:AraC-like DNA-binding protein
MRYFVSGNSLPLNYTNSGKLQNEGGFIHPRRSLKTFVIIVCLNGTLYIAQDNVQYTLKENQFIILFAGHKHFGFKKSEGSLSYFWCHFKAWQNKYQILDGADIQGYFHSRQKAPPGHSDRKTDISYEKLSGIYLIPEHGEISPDGRAVLIFRQLLDLARTECYSGQIRNYTLSTLAMEITQEYIKKNYKHKNKALNPSMEKVIEWIRINYSKPRTMKQIAKLFNYNTDYLTTAFRLYTGIPLMRYINLARIDAAKKLLLTTTQSIKEIAYKVGFEDEKVFMKRFKKLEDTTPTKYRNAFNRAKIVSK